MLQRFKVAVLAQVRRGREVAWTPEFMGFGNVLLLLMWAQARRELGKAAYVLVRPGLEHWLEVFPGLRDLALTKAEVRFTDRRVMPWSAAAREQRVEYTVAPHQSIDIAQMERLIREHLLVGSPLLPAGGASDDDGCLVVNVRRGDYYSDDDNRARYGFDVERYLREAVPAAVRQRGGATSIHIVSDGPDWCREHLGWLADLAPLTFAPTGDDAVVHFVRIASSRRIVVTNSTFSYCAAYVSNVLHGDNHDEVWAPDFFDRTQNGGRSWLLDSRWSVVRDLPGGWDVPAG